MKTNSSAPQSASAGFSDAALPEPAQHKPHRAVGLWLAISAGMVFTMMIIGAITRLTESGLSMVEWRPLIGAIPPLSEAEWLRIFDLYRATSEYQLANAGMSLSEFKEIFWWEYIHRVWGRLIGVVYAIPFFYFLFTKRLPAGQTHHYWILLFLGGMQGVVGWWMVKSGFVDRDDVSQYRLALHLSLAFIILAYLFWMAVSRLYPIEPGRVPVKRSIRRLGAWAHVVIFTTVVSGAFVAGSNAGFIYNDWPFMNGKLLPDDFYSPEFGWISAFEEHGTIQFNHRILAYISLAYVSFVFLFSQKRDLGRRVRTAIAYLTIAIWLQAGLGITTLMTMIWMPLAVLHQAGAAIVFLLSVFLMYELRGKPSDRQPS